ncbi:MAG: SpoIID/LytB domain-containing protein [Cyanobacteria bacterium P01_D01_bin.105]
MTLSDCRFKAPLNSVIFSQIKHVMSATLSGAVLTGAVATGPVVIGPGAIGAIAPGIGMGTGVLALQSVVMPHPAQAQSVTTNPEIKVGIVQRFGEIENDKIILAPLAGDTITVSFQTQGQAQTITTNRLQIDFAMQPLAQPQLEEWVVLSTHRSFESAEASAKQWQTAGIEAEIAQPDAWQVWAKRDHYSTPLVRRLLLENLQAAGYATTFIDSRVVKEIPKVAFTADGFRYARDTFNISTSNRRLQMNHGPNAGSRTQFRDLYAGDMKIQPNSYGNYTLVNQVPVDAYLRGVVPHEIGPSAPRSAIEAQTILARTYALRNLRRFAIDDYEICADTQCQVYFGLAEADAVADGAIAATSGQVLTYNNELVDALYSSTAGGITARFTDVWNGEDRPYLRPVIDSLTTQWDIATRPLSDEANFRAFIALQDGFNEDSWPTFRWNRQASLKEIGVTMKEYLSNRQHPLADFNKITGLTVIERADSGRVQKVNVDTDIGSFELIKDEAVKAFVPPRSLLFYLEPIMETPKASDAEPTSVANAPKPTDTATAETNTLQSPNANNPNLNLNSNNTETNNTASENIETNNTEANNTEEKLNIPTEKQSVPVLTGYRFIGGGFGHGVGMSQTGAYNLGDQGYSSKQILEFYYPGTELKPISESTIFYNNP